MREEPESVLLELARRAGKSRMAEITTTLMHMGSAASASTLLHTGGAATISTLPSGGAGGALVATPHDIVGTGGSAIIMDEWSTTMATTSSIGDSSWRMTSVRWLEDRGYYTPSTKSASKRLLMALERMEYGRADEEFASITGLSGTAQELRERIVKGWGSEDHSLMASYIKNGGYSGRRAEIIESAGITEPEERISIEGSDTANLEDITVAESAVVRPAKPEADESLEFAVAHSSSFAGSW